MSCQLSQGLSRTRKKEESLGDSRTDLGVVHPHWSLPLQAVLHKDVIYPPATVQTSLCVWSDLVELERIRGQDDLRLMNFYLITYLRVVWFSLVAEKPRLSLTPQEVLPSCPGWLKALPSYLSSSSGGLSMTASSHLERCLQTTEHICL